jgi:hypothetical protein
VTYKIGGATFNQKKKRKEKKQNCQNKKPFCFPGFLLSWKKLLMETYLRHQTAFMQFPRIYIGTPNILSFLLSFQFFTNGN